MAKIIANPKITCDDCGQVFKLKMKMIIRKKITDEVDTTFFKCPHCGRKYVVTYEDKEFKDNIEKMSGLQDRLSKQIVESDAYNEILKKYQEYHERNIEISKGYKKIYGS